MRDEIEIMELRRQVTRTKALIRQTAMRVEDLEASIEEVYRFKDRLTMLPRHTDVKRPVRVDPSENVVDFVLT